MWDFAARAGSDDGREADRASLLAGALTAVPDGSPLLRKFPGAGLIRTDRGVQVAMLVDQETTPDLANTATDGVPEPTLLGRTSFLDFVQAIFGSSPDWLSDVAVIPVTPPVRQTTISAPVTTGTAGARVRWNAGQGFLTAGHVAPSVGSTIDDPTGTTVGIVRWAHDPFNNGTVAEPDLSIVEDCNGYTIGTPFSATGKAGPADAITVTTTSTPGTLMGFLAYLFMPGQNQTLGDCYMSTYQISNPGDSGSPVIWGSYLIGHVVGASIGMTSYIQDIDYLLKEGANPLRSGLPGLRI